MTIPEFVEKLRAGKLETLDGDMTDEGDSYTEIVPVPPDAPFDVIVAVAIENDVYPGGGVSMKDWRAELAAALGRK